MTNSANYGGIASHLIHVQAMFEPNFSVLRDYYMRPLPVALAHRLVRARSSDPYVEIFHRLYESLTTSDRAQCLAEINRQPSFVLGHSPTHIALA
jgi:hypothetical protein